jgi:hypothetical protein
MLVAMGFFLLFMLCLLVVATLLVWRHSDTPSRSRQDGYLGSAQGRQGNSYRFTLLSVRFSHRAILHSSQPGWAEYASLIPRTEKEKSCERRNAPAQHDPSL